MLTESPRVADPVAAVVKGAGAILQGEHPGQWASDRGRILGMPEVEQLVNPPDRRDGAAAHGAVGPDPRGELLPEPLRQARIARERAAERLPGEVRLTSRPGAEVERESLDRLGAHAAPRRHAEDATGDHRPSHAKGGESEADGIRLLRRTPPGRPRPFTQRADQSENQPPRTRAEAAEPERAEQGEQERLDQEDPDTAQPAVSPGRAQARQEDLPEDQPDRHREPGQDDSAQGHTPLTTGLGCCRVRASGPDSSPARWRACCGCRRAGPAPESPDRPPCPGRPVPGNPPAGAGPRSGWPR